MTTRRGVEVAPPVETLIVGAGGAGLYAALKLAPRPVVILTARVLGRGGSSPWAQGGVAAAVAPDDAPALHAVDTIAAGAGLVDPEAARVLCDDGPARVRDLRDLGAPFDLDGDGNFKVGREAAHSRNRVIHASGDAAGAAIMAALVDAARRASHITILERMVVEDLVRDDDARVRGVLVYDVTHERRVLHPAGAVVLATGGLGGLYAVTTNPVRAQGHGLAFAARAGAVVRDPEFVQFHPTALDVGADPAPLATEALRGDGARLVNADGRAFMESYHPDADLAPRDVVARAVEAERAAGRGALLDARNAVGDAFPHRYPTVFAAAGGAGLAPRRAALPVAPACDFHMGGILAERHGGSAARPPRREALPVAPACHYHMGGILTDLHGRSTVDGLYAVGEVASSGVHGANRLASNSLLEAVVFGGRVADAIAEAPSPRAPSAAAASLASIDAQLSDRLALAPKPAPPEAAARLRAAMSARAALLRDADGLAELDAALDALASGPMTSGLFSALIVCRLITTAAAARRESRGGHYRTDHPERSADPAHSHCALRPDGDVDVALRPHEPASPTAATLAAALPATAQ
ncbi:MAG: FAD-binding protein [Parvularculaceae bacterium]